MRFAALFLFLAVGSWASADGLAGPAAATSDLDRLQGYWLLYALLQDEELPAHPGEGALLQVSGNQARSVEQGKKSQDDPQEMSFTIDPRQNPKTIDIHWLEHDKKITWKGIYTLTEEEVRIAVAFKLAKALPLQPGEERPASFDVRKPPKDSGVLIFVLKRAKADQLAAKNDAKTQLPPSIAFDGFGAVALSPDGKCLAASGAPGTVVRLWDTASGKEMGVLRGHDSEVRRTVFSSDGKRLFTATTTEVRIWDVAAGKQLQHIIPVGPLWHFKRLILSGDEKWFLSDPEMEQEIAPDGQCVMATMRLWEVETGKEVRRFEITRTTAQIVGQYLDYFVRGKGSDAIVGAALSHDGKWVVAGTQRGEVHLWNGATGKKVRTFGRSSDIGAIPVGFSGDGKWLVTDNLTPLGTKYRCVIRVWDVATGKEKHAIEEYVFDPSLPVRNVFEPILTNDGKWLIGVTGAEETTVRIWNVETGKEVRAFAGSKNAMTHGWVSRDKKSLATYDQGGRARLWDVGTGKELGVLEVRTGRDRLWPCENFQVCAGEDVKLLVTWTPSRLTLWDLENGKAIRSMWR